MTTYSKSVTDVSIHAPTWGATAMSIKRSFNPLCFNPRTHVGCDTEKFTVFHYLNGFNPRTHVGCDISFVDTVIKR